MTIRKIDLMHDLFREVTNKTCKDCCHLVSYTASKTWYKCECYGISNSEGTDWRLKWTACGLINQDYDGNPVVKMVQKKTTKKETVMEGQVSLFE